MRVVVLIVAAATLLLLLGTYHSAGAYQRSVLVEYFSNWG